MWANIDNDPNAVVFASPTASAEVNSLGSIITPDSGILLINGSAFVNMDDAVPTNFRLSLFINGNPVDNHSFLASSGSSIQGGITAEALTLSYTYATAVAATTLTVSQTLGAGIPSRFTYNKNNLTVIFFPTLLGGAGINFPGIPAGAHTYIAPVCEDGDLCP